MDIPSSTVLEDILPGEVINMILEFINLHLPHLDRRDVCALLLVNKDANNFINRSIAQRLEVRSDSNNRGDFSVVGFSRDRIEPSSVRNWLPSMVQALDLHVYGLCEHSWLQMGMPDLKLQSVRLFPPHRPVNPPCQGAVNNSPCNPLRIIRPRTLVIRDPSPGWTYRVEAGIYSADIERVDFVLGDFLLTRISRRDPILYMDTNLFPSVKAVTVIFPGLNWGPGAPYTTETHLAWLAKHARTLFEALLQMVLNNKNVCLTIVNVASISLDIARPFFETDGVTLESARDQQVLFQSWFLNNLYNLAPNAADDGEEKDEVLKRVRVCSMKEWIAEGSAAGVLVDEELQPWLESTSLV